MDSLNLELGQVPDNAYEILYESLPEELKPLNGGVIQTHFPYWNSSWADARKLAFAYHKPIARYYPFIRQMNEVYRVGNVIPGMINAGLQEQEHTLNREIEFDFIDRCEIWKHEQSPIRMSLDNRIPAKFRVAKFLRNNPDQYVTEIRTRMYDSLYATLLVAINRMGKFCIANNCEFSLRHPLAFSSPMADTLVTLAATRNIDVPELYYGSGMGLVVEALKHSNLYTSLFAQIANESVNASEGERNKIRYMQWHQMLANAIIRSSDTGAMLALVPAGIPAQMILPIVNSIPYYTTPLMPTGLMLDWLVGVQRTNSVDFIHYDTITESMLKAGYLMSLIAILVSIVVSNIQTGRGVHKPTWIMSPISIEFLRFIDPFANWVLNETKDF